MNFVLARNPGADLADLKVISAMNYAPFIRSFRWLGLISLALCVSCNQGPSASESIELDFEVASLEEGKFAIAGSTTLPDNTRLIAAAIRYLEPDQPIITASEPTYSILDYEPVTIQDGQLSATLDLWQVAPDGRYQEAWQTVADSLALEVTPDDAVQFVVTLAPPSLIGSLYKALEAEGLELGSSLIRSTPEGETFLLAETSLDLDLPQGETTPPPELATRINGGWGQRYLLVAEPPLPYTLKPSDERKTNAPVSPEEFLY